MFFVVVIQLTWWKLGAYILCVRKYVLYVCMNSDADTSFFCLCSVLAPNEVNNYSSEFLRKKQKRNKVYRKQVPCYGLLIKAYRQTRVRWASPVT
jgi:hypothetical protein